MFHRFHGGGVGPMGFRPMRFVHGGGLYRNANFIPYGRFLESPLNYGEDAEPAQDMAQGNDTIPPSPRSAESPGDSQTPSHPEYQRDHGDDHRVRQAQHMLNMLGGYGNLGPFGPGKNGEDGVLGPYTLRVLNKFREAHGIAPSDSFELDDATLQALNQEIVARGMNAPYGMESPVPLIGPGADISRPYNTTPRPGYPQRRHRDDLGSDDPSNPQRLTGLPPKPSNAFSPGGGDRSLPPEAKAVLDAVASKEGADYNTIVGAGMGGVGAPATFSDFSHHPNIAGMLTYQGKSTGAGRYQMEFPTWEALRAKYHYPDFSPASQDRAAWDNSRDNYRDATGRDLLADLRANPSRTLETLAHSLRGQWAATRDADQSQAGMETFKSIYSESLQRHTQQASLEPTGPHDTLTDRTLLGGYARRLAAGVNAPTGNEYTAPGDVAAARAYLNSISEHPERTGDTSYLHPEMALRMAAAFQEARRSGLPNAGLISGYRSPYVTGSSYDASGYSDHSYGTAFDVGGIGTAGSRESYLWHSIAEKHGLHGIYGPDNPAEFNHYQLTPTKLENDPERMARLQAAVKTGKLEEIWKASGIPLPAENSAVSHSPPPTPVSPSATSLMRPDGHTAVYDIAAHTVLMPDGSKLEAHSGLAEKEDDPKSSRERDSGVTPPNMYGLNLRPGLFHGVQAIQLNPAPGSDMRASDGGNRDGILAHPYMLNVPGSPGQSNGCVSFKDYPAFLHAVEDGEVSKLLVVPHLPGAIGAAPKIPGRPQGNAESKSIVTGGEAVKEAALDIKPSTLHLAAVQQFELERRKQQEAKAASQHVAHA